MPPAFTARFLDTLPGDPLLDLNPRQVHGALWSRVPPTPVPTPRLVAWSKEVAELLGLDEATVTGPEGVAVLAGNALWPGMQPFSANYGGHQFGSWAGQLGDGRAIVLGELKAPSGELWELQLKGAGPTPYSRRADGRAVLRSSIREFLCSEAMFHLGVPTTRALSLVDTGEGVVRDMFYDGNPAMEPGAIVCRVSPSFLRFGNFELCASRDDHALLASLGAYALAHHFPELGSPSKSAYAALFHEVARRTARLIAHWQAVGFVHGVMNTDNMSLLGLTIDYGPYGWVDNLDLGWTPNTTDAGMRRYAFGNQPGVGLWNIERLGLALMPLFEDDEQVLEEGLTQYQRVYAQASSAHFAAKLGLEALEDEADVALVQDCLATLAAEETDWTNFFRALSHLAAESEAPGSLPAAIEACLYRPQSVDAEHRQRLTQWLARWWTRAGQGGASRAEVSQRMLRVNPKYVLRNYLAQQVIDAAHDGDDSKVMELLEVMRRPFDEQPGREAFAQKRPDWARNKPGCSALSCSS